MDILGFLTNNFGQIALSTALAAGGSWVALWIAKSGVGWARNIAVNAAMGSLEGVLKDRDNKRLALEVVRWVEIKLPTAVGSQKKQAAVRCLSKSIPGLNDNDAGELVEFGVAQINAALKQIERGILEEK